MPNLRTPEPRLHNTAVWAITPGRATIKPVKKLEQTQIEPATAPQDWEARTEYVVSLVREMSRMTDPDDVVRLYFAKSLGWLPRDASISLSRRELSRPAVRVTRNSLWAEKINPWTQPQRLPVIEGGVLAELLYGGEPRMIEDFQAARTDPAYEMLKDFRGLIAVPHFHEGLAQNMVLHLWHEPVRFQKDRFPDLVLTSNLFGRATQALVFRQDMARAYQEVDRELEAVAAIQRSLLPVELPAIPTLELAACYQTSRRAGGDYYDLFPLPGGRWGIFIADVSGHGTAAAVMMAITHSIAHSYCGSLEPPGQILTYLNDKFINRYTQETATFATAFYGVYDPSQRTLRYAMAGHVPPRLRQCDGTVQAVAAVSGLPLGILPGHGYHEAEISLCANAQILLFTDGIVETFSPAADMFGYERLDAIVSRPHATAKALIDDVLGEVERFGGGRPMADDRTMLAMRVM